MNLIEREVEGRLEKEVGQLPAQCHSAVSHSQAQTRRPSVRRPFPCYNSTYQVCTRCGEVIPPRQKKVVPSTIVETDCGGVSDRAGIRDKPAGDQSNHIEISAIETD